MMIIALVMRIMGFNKIRFVTADLREKTCRSAICGTSAC